MIFLIIGSSNAPYCISIWDCSPRSRYFPPISDKLGGSSSGFLSASRLAIALMRSLTIGGTCNVNGTVRSSEMSGVCVRGGVFPNCADRGFVRGAAGCCEAARSRTFAILSCPTSPWAFFLLKSNCGITVDFTDLPYTFLTHFLCLNFVKDQLEKHFLSFFAR